MAELHGIMLRELFAASQEELPPVTLGTLAKTLNVPVMRLAPLVEAGYLLAQSQGQLSAASYVESIPQEAINWLRHWFMPARNKPLFALEDVAKLTELTSRKVLALTAKHGLPVIFDPAFGHMFSAMTVKKLMMFKAGGKRYEDNRFDRQALLWRLMEGDPERVAEMPPFSQQLEDEIERVAKLEQPMRDLRALAIRNNFRDAKKLSPPLVGPVWDEIERTIDQIAAR